MNPEETQYLDIIKSIMDSHHSVTMTRGSCTKSVFAPPPMKFSLERFPLITTKRVSLRLVFEELMWFIRGCTDGVKLQEKNVNIWTAHGTREYLDSIGLSQRREHDLGPIYGFQWRHFGAEYITCDTDYTGKGTDQLEYIFHEIIFNPTSRRIIMSAWNPSDLYEMVLPPCHMFVQFNVENSGPTPILSCQLYQRSADMGLGVPFNIASYALLLVMIAKVVGYEVGEFTHVIGDAHMYLDHTVALTEQVKREPRLFPVLDIKIDRTEILRGDKPLVDNCIRALESIKFSDLTLYDYNPAQSLFMKMSV